VRSDRRLDRALAAARVIEDLGKGEAGRSSAEMANDARDDLAERVEMISAFQGHGEPVPAQAGRQGRAPGHEFDVSGGRQDERRERVAVVRIDPQAHEDDVRPELLDDRLDNPVMRREVRRVPTPRRERDVHGEPAALSLSDILRRARARIDPVLVGGQVQDGRAAREHVAGPVPVMGVVVQDGDAPSLGDLIRGGDGDVVQITEAASVVGPGMMARRSHEGDARPPVADRGSRPVQDGPRREGREVERPRVHGRLGVQPTFAEISEVLEVRRVVDSRELGGGRGGRPLDIREQIRPFQVGDNRPQPIRPLHMKGRRDVVQEPGIVDQHGRGRAGADFKASSSRFQAVRNELITIENHAAKHLRIVPARLSELDFICSIQSADRGGMRVFSPRGTGVILLVGALVVVGSLPLGRPAAHVDSGAMSFWEAAGRGLVSATVVNETYVRDGLTVTAPVGIRLDSAADVPVVVSEEAVLMSPHPLESPTPDPLRTTQDAVLTVQTIPAHGSLNYSYGDLAVQGFLPHPTWWCSEEFQFTQAEIHYRIGGETLPFALRPILANEHHEGPSSNTQSDFWTYLRSNPTVVIGKEPLWTQLDGTAGQTIHVTIEATNIAVYTFEDTITNDVNVTHGVLEDTVPAGWSVEEGSYSVPPDDIVSHDDGSRTLRWNVDLPAALDSGSEDPQYPSAYEPLTRSYTLVAPALAMGRMELPRAESDMDRDGIADAASAPSLVETVSVGVPLPDAGGPYTGKEGDTILLSASRSTDPDGDPLQFRWDFTGDGTFDTPWSSVPTAEMRYTDDFSGVAVVEVSDGLHVAEADATVTIANRPPEIRRLDAVARAAFRIEIAGEKWHDLSFTVDSDTGLLASLNLSREPGSPSNQAATTDVLTFSLREHVTATLAYTPLNDRVNGQMGGDNPAWIVVVFPDGQETRMFHNFNVRHPTTWSWTLPDLPAFFVRSGITFRASLHDAGSDDLIATWEFGDGTSVRETFWNNGMGPDPPQSQGGTAPFDVTAAVVHGHRPGGSFTVTLTVRDDDGGVTQATLALSNL